MMVPLVVKLWPLFRPPTRIPEPGAYGNCSDRMWELEPLGLRASDVPPQAVTMLVLPFSPYSFTFSFSHTTIAHIPTPSTFGTGMLFHYFA